MTTAASAKGAAASPRAPRSRIVFIVAIATAALLFLAGCSEDPVAAAARQATGVSKAHGIWTPGPNDTCSKEAHDAYSVVGDDGKLYPTWHPPVDPTTGCSFGHEHGRDPRGSDLYLIVGDMPFAVANEALEVWDPANPRREDHVGHKIEWENDVPMRVGTPVGEAILQVTCDVMVKLHQGTHSKDAFTNNLHEMVYHIRCNDGSAAHLTFMAAIGTPGEFVRSCNHEQHVTVGVATPPNSPKGGGKRILPDAGCMQEFVIRHDGTQSDFGRGLHESWQTSSSITTATGRSLASFDPYFQVPFPSRFHDPSQSGLVGRPVDLCFLPGDRALGGPCAQTIRDGGTAGMAYDDPRSAFNGVRRFVDLNGFRIDNRDGPTVWYTNPFGRGGRTEPFPGSVRQVIAKMSNSALRLSGPSIGRNRYYGGVQTHAPQSVPAQPPELVEVDVPARQHGGHARARR